MEAYLSGSDLSGANLSVANLRGADLNEANLNGANQINLTNHPSTDYSFVVLPLINP